jgi:hypothetical protein
MGAARHRGVVRDTSYIRRRIVASGRRWFHWILAAQGIYYAATALWAWLAFEHFQRWVALPINEFQVNAFSSLALPLGVALAAAGLRPTATLFAVRLGAGTAFCLTMTELLWLPSFEGLGALWLDLAAEIAFTLALGVVALRPRSFDVGGTAR